MEPRDAFFLLRLLNLAVTCILLSVAPLALFKLPGVSPHIVVNKEENTQKKIDLRILGRKRGMEAREEKVKDQMILFGFMESRVTLYI